MWRIRQFKRRIINLISWFPVIWKDEQWDAYYIEKILLHKIKRVRKYTEKRQFYVGWENDVKWMKKCEYLLTMILDSKYWDDEYDNKYISKNMIGETEFYKLLISKGMCNDLWENKARMLFWKIFVAQYEKWWD